MATRIRLWSEQVFATIRRLGNSADEIVAVALRHLSDEEAERLTVWIANRIGRAQALAGDRGPIGRLDHVCRHWLSEGQRSALLCWLMRRIALGAPRVPESSSRPPRQVPGAAPERWRLSTTSSATTRRISPPGARALTG